MSKQVKIFLCLTLIFSIIISSFTGCSKAEIKDTSMAGAYYLIFKELVESENVNISRYKFLSFDIKSCGLEGEELEALRNYIRNYCEEAGVEYLEYDLVGLRRSFHINQSIYGEEFTDGYLLSFSLGEFYIDYDDTEYFTADVNFWHGDMDGIGATDFYIVKTSDGWYIDRDTHNSGYSMMYQ